MGDVKAGDENIRKIQKTGNDSSSYMLTLPKELVKNLGWREHQKVVVEQAGDVLVIKDWQN